MKRWKVPIVVMDVDSSKARVPPIKKRLRKTGLFYGLIKVASGRSLSRQGSVIIKDDVNILLVIVILQTEVLASLVYFSRPDIYFTKFW